MSRKFNLASAKKMHENGKTYKQIASFYGTTEQRVKNEFYLAKKEGTFDKLGEKGKPGRPPGSKNKRTIAEEQMLTNWKSSNAAPMMREDKAELNRAAGWFVTECLKLGQSTNKVSIESLYNSLGKYIELCTQTGMPMLVKTCQLALGVTPQTFSGWRRGKNRSGDPRYKEFAELVDAVVGAGMEAAAAAGSIDRVLTIWWEKSHFNMIEGNGQSADVDDPLGQRMTAKEIVQKYDNLPD